MIGAEKQDGFSHFFGFADPSQQVERTTHAISFYLVVPGQFLDHARPSPAWGNGVDAYFVSGQVHGFVSRELQHRRLGYGIQPSASLRHLRADAAKINHGAAASFHHVGLNGFQHHDPTDDVDVVTVEPILARCIQSIVDVNASQVNQEVDATEL